MTQSGARPVFMVVVAGRVKRRAGEKRERRLAEAAEAESESEKRRRSRQRKREREKKRHKGKNYKGFTALQRFLSLPSH